MTVVGQAASISAGEWITASGEWVNDRTHGQQFRARFLKTSAPTSIEGIEKYLGSGMIRGIGPAYAKKLVRAFGEKMFDTIGAEPDRLREIDGMLTTVGLCPLSASPSPALSYPDCRSVLTLIVAHHRGEPIRTHLVGRACLS